MIISTRSTERIVVSRALLFYYAIYEEEKTTREGESKTEKNKKEIGRHKPKTKDFNE